MRDAQVREQLQLGDPPLVLDQGPGLGGCGPSVAGLGPRVYLLTSGGLAWGRLMPWSERLKTLQARSARGWRARVRGVRLCWLAPRGLRRGPGCGSAAGAAPPSPPQQDIQKFKLGLQLALSFYRNAQTAAAGVPAARAGAGTAAGHRRAAAAGGFARCEGAGAEPQQLEQWLLSLMLLHVGTALHDLGEAALRCGAAGAQPPATVAGAGAGGVEQEAEADGAGARAAAANAATPLARLALHACALLQRPAVLFERAFPLFAGAPPAAGALGAFLEVLEPAVVGDVLQARAGAAAPSCARACTDAPCGPRRRSRWRGRPRGAVGGAHPRAARAERAERARARPRPAARAQGLGPEVMQALVEHFAAKGEPQRVERCVLHLSIAALDLDQARACECGAASRGDGRGQGPPARAHGLPAPTHARAPRASQVVRLCERHRLHSASLYVLTRINDYRKPLVDLLGALAAAQAAAAAAEAGGGAAGAAEHVAAARGVGLKLLVWIRGAFRGRAYPPGTGLLPA